MKNKLFFTVALLAAIVNLNVMAQNTKKRLTLPDESQLVYNLKDNSFNGPYTITNKNNVLITRGAYANDLRVGNWYFFNSDGSIFLRYNYDLKKVLALDIKALAFANVKVDDVNESSNASIPIPLMAVEQYVDLLSILVKQKIPMPIKNNNDKLEVQIVANIDETGNAKYTAKYKLDNVENVQHFDLIGQQYSIAWVPASLNNTSYKSQFSFNLALNFSKERIDAGNQKRFNWN